MSFFADRSLLADASLSKANITWPDDKGFALLEPDSTWSVLEKAQVSVEVLLCPDEEFNPLLLKLIWTEALSTCCYENRH